MHSLPPPAPAGSFVVSGGQGREDGLSGSYDKYTAAVNGPSHMAAVVPTSGPAPGPDVRFVLRTLGAVALLLPDGRTALGPGVPLALLAYLLASPGRRARREHLAATFWSNSDSVRARQALRKNLSRLRHVLGEDAFEDQGSEVRAQVPVQYDRDAFLEMVGRGDLTSAVALYRGPFFPEFGSPGAAEFEHWVEAERERLRILFLQGVDTVVRAGLDRGQPREVLALVQRAVAEAPESESASRLLLEVHLAARDPAGAALEAARISRVLGTEGRRPEPATARLIGRITEEKPGEPADPDPMLEPELVGREREFHRLLRAWHTAAGGRGVVLRVEGRAGVGKTRLLREVVARIEMLGGRTVMVRARPGERDVAFALAADLALALAQLPGARGISPRAAEWLVGLHPGLGSVFPAVGPAPSAPDRLHQVALAMGELAAAVSDDGPVAVLIDDMHWADEASVRVAGLVAPRLRDAAALLVTAGRPGGNTAPGGEVERILLAPLTLSDVEALLAGIAAFMEPSLGRRLAAGIHAASGGLPMFVLETLHLASEQGLVTRVEGAWSVTDPDGVTRWLESLRPVEGRLASLSTPARQVLLTLAATGAPVAPGDIAAAVGTGNLSPATIAELERRGYLALRDDRWDLAHDEIGETVVRLASEQDRVQAHAALGRALLRHGPDHTRHVRRAARHLVLGQAEDDLARLFRRWVQDARARGDLAPARSLAGEMLGGAGGPDVVKRLIRALPWHLRFPVMGVLLARLIRPGTAETPPSGGSVE